MEWFRVWHDYFDDPKLRACSKARKFDIVSMLRLASGNNPRGRIDLEDEDIADYLGLTTPEFAELAEFLTRKRIVGRDCDGRLVFLNWERRQPKSDNVAERVAKSRANKAQEQPVTLQPPACNVTETYDVTGIHNRTEQNRAEKKTPSARPASRGTRLESPFELPDEWKEFAERERPHLDAIVEGQKFADYWHAIPGSKGLKSDWFATWRNYVRSDMYGRGQAVRNDTGGRQASTQERPRFTKKGFEDLYGVSLD